MFKVKNCKLEIIHGNPTIKADIIAEPHLINIEPIIVEQWFLDLCAELRELKTYECMNDAYDELGLY